MSFGGVDLIDINLNIDSTRNAANAAIGGAARLQEQARDAALAEYEKGWEWKDRQTELLAQVVEEQKRLTEERVKDRRLTVATAIIAGATLAATILVPLVMRVL